LLRVSSWRRPSWVKRDGKWRSCSATRMLRHRPSGTSVSLPSGKQPLGPAGGGSCSARSTHMAIARSSGLAASNRLVTDSTHQPQALAAGIRTIAACRVGNEGHSVAGPAPHMQHPVPAARTAASDIKRALAVGTDWWLLPRVQHVTNHLDLVAGEHDGSRGFIWNDTPPTSRTVE